MNYDKEIQWIDDTIFQYKKYIEMYKSANDKNNVKKYKLEIEKLKTKKRIIKIAKKRFNGVTVERSEIEP